jgi:hypothetical protein
MRYNEMLKLGELADGDRGVALVELWKEINQRCFEGRLCPLPIQWVTCMPYGRCVGSIRHSHAKGHQRTARIEIMRTRSNKDAALILLHEMVHQSLMEQDMDPSHISAFWRKELVRLSLDVFGKSVVVPREMVRKFMRDDGLWSSRRELEQVPILPSHLILNRAQSAQWPHSLIEATDIPPWLSVVTKSPPLKTSNDRL